MDLIEQADLASTTQTYQRKLRQPPYPPLSFPTSAHKLLVPPLNFALVVPGIYRSGHPNPRNHAFLLKLGIRTIVYMNEDDPQPSHIDFVKTHRIAFHHYRVGANKEPSIETDAQAVAAILGILTDTRRYPILVHCNKGKKRIGCLVGCLRKLQHWSMATIFDEYQRFSGSKVRIADQQFIEFFNEPIDINHEHRPSWLG
ncbi:tyrosine-protein phosphatase siw14 [Dispira simplex]|nr:tyrosine-protein phosphatase siw14 [Dispira simplex]